MAIAERIRVPVSAEELRRRLDRLPRFHLTDLPTPLHELPNLSAALDGPRVFMKREDLTQWGLGGNKNRKFQFEVGDALAQGCDVLVWGGGAAQSNHARQCAAAARRAGLDVVLLLNRGPHADLRQGNRLLLDLMDADVRITGRDSLFGTDVELDRIAADLRGRGRRPYVIRYGPLTAVGYVECLLEIIQQAAAAGFAPARIYVCSGGGTQAGLELGKRALGLTVEIRGYTPVRVEGGRAPQQAHIATMAAEGLGLDVRFDAKDFWNSDAQVGPGYAEVTPAAVEAIRLVARTEGIFLEPVYTGKAFAGLLHDLRAGDWPRHEPVVFVHTGGLPLVFTYAEELARR